MEEETKGIFKKAVDAVNPGWLSFCGGIGLLAFMFAVSFRIMDFNPGPLWEKHYDVIIEERKNKNACDVELEERLKMVEQLAHQKGE